MHLLIFFTQACCYLRGGDWLPRVEEGGEGAAEEEAWQGRETWLRRGRNLSRKAAGRRLTYFLDRVCSQRYRAAWSRAGAAEGARPAARQDFLRAPRSVGSFQPACFLAGHPLQMEARLLERGPTVFLPPTAIAPPTSPFTLEKTRPSWRLGS